MKKLLNFFTFLLAICFCCTFQLIAQDDCTTPTLVTSLPHTASNIALNGLSNDYDMQTFCGGQNVNGPDYVFKYTPTST